MSPTTVKPKTTTKTTLQRPPLYKVILLNDDYTPREFVVSVLKAVFRMGEETASRVMLTAHQKGACVIAVYTRDVAETKAKEATELGKAKGYPLVLHHRAGGVGICRNLDPSGSGRRHNSQSGAMPCQSGSVHYRVADDIRPRDDPAAFVRVP